MSVIVSWLYLPNADSSCILKIEMVSPKNSRTLFIEMASRRFSDLFCSAFWLSYFLGILFYAILLSMWFSCLPSIFVSKCERKLVMAAVNLFTFVVLRVSVFSRRVAFLQIDLDSAAYSQRLFTWVSVFIFQILIFWPSFQNYTRSFFGVRLTHNPKHPIRRTLW